MDPTYLPIPPDELFRHAGFLRRVARELVRSEHHAEDVVQDAMVAAIECPPRERGALRGWLSRVVRRRALNLNRGERRRAGRESDVARPEAHESHEEALERLELQRLVFDLVLDQPEDRRTVLYLRYYEGLGPTAIAERLGIPVKTVKSRLARSLESLRARLDSRFDGDRSRWFAALAPIAFPRGVPISTPPVGGEALPLVGAGGLLVKAILISGAACAALLVAILALRNGEPVKTDTMAETDLEVPIDELPGSTGLEEPTPAETFAMAVDNAARQPVAAVEAPMAADRGALEVQVSWPDDSPAAGVGIVVTCNQDPAPREELFRGRTDQRGVAHFPELFAGDVDLFVDRGSRGKARVVSGETEVVELRIPEGLDVRGRVETPEGEPVTGAQVWLAGSSWRYWTAGLAALTAADGSFTLRHLGSDTRLGARAEGWSPSVLHDAEVLPIEGSTRTVTLVLGEVGGSVNGRVLDPAGEPVGGATVLVGERGGHIVDLPTGMRGATPAPISVRTAPDGTFHYPGGLPHGTMPLRVLARGFPVYIVQVEVVHDGVTEVEVRLASPATIAGRVFHTDGRPAAGAALGVARGYGESWFPEVLPVPESVADAEGFFRLEWVPPGATEVNAFVPSDARAGRCMAELLVRAGEEHELELSLSLGKTITGTVVDGDGEPLVGWGVWARCPMGFGVNRQDRTDDLGRFLLANLGEAQYAGSDQNYTLKVAAPGEAPVPPRAELEGVVPGTENLVLVVEESATPDVMVSGVLLDADGTTPADVKLVYRPYPGLTGLFVDYDLANGSFLYGPVRPDRFQMVVYRGGLSRVVALTPWLEVDSGETCDVGTIQLERPGRVEVVLDRREGLPENLELSLARDGCSSEEFLLDNDIHRSRELLPGTWTLQSWHNGPWSVRPQPVEVVSGRTVRITGEFVRQVQVQFTVRIGGSSKGWSSFSLRVLSDDTRATIINSRYPSTRLRGGSSPHQLRIPEGRYRVIAEVDDGRRAEVAIEVDPLSPPEEPYVLIVE